MLYNKFEVLCRYNKQVQLICFIMNFIGDHKGPEFSLRPWPSDPLGTVPVSFSQTPAYLVRETTDYRIHC